MAKPGVVGLNFLYRAYKSTAKEKGYAFKLSKKRFKELTQSNCHYCGIEPKQIITPYFKKERSETCLENSKYIYNGIDRIDSDIGYITNNCVPCCSKCNYCKMCDSYDDHIKYLNQLVIFRSSKSCQR